MSLLNDRMEEIYKERIETEPNDYVNVEKTWAKEIEILCEDMDDTIRYLMKNVQLMDFHGLVK